MLGLGNVKVQSRAPDSAQMASFAPSYLFPAFRPADKTRHRNNQNNPIRLCCKSSFHRRNVQMSHSHSFMHPLLLHLEPAYLKNPSTKQKPKTQRKTMLWDCQTPSKASLSNQKIVLMSLDTRGRSEGRQTHPSCQYEAEGLLTDRFKINVSG